MFLDGRGILVFLDNHVSSDFKKHEPPQNTDSHSCTRPGWSIMITHPTPPHPAMYGPMGLYPLILIFSKKVNCKNPCFLTPFFFKSNSTSPKGSQLNLLLSLSHEADRARSTRSWNSISDQSRSGGVGPYEVMRPTAIACAEDLVKKSTEPAAVPSNFVSLRYDQRLLITQGEIPNKQPRIDI